MLANKLIDGFDEDKLELIGLDDDDVCEDNVLGASSVPQLEDRLNAYFDAMLEVALQLRRFN
jgi:hypothetical protein